MTVRGIKLELSRRTYIMGILNVTPDSFSDGGRFLDKEKAVRHALDMISDGADIVDIGGESTRPGAEEVSVDEECSRVIPIIRELSKKTDAVLSVDTRKPVVAEEALKAGARIVNDVSGLRYDERMASVAKRYGAALILMHMKGTPKNMQTDPQYGDVVKEVARDLSMSVKIAIQAGVSEDSIIVDPGIGFGKSLEHNLEILNRLEELAILGRPICVGTSRKSFIGKVLNVPEPANRLIGTVATCVIAVLKGASILRVHDVKEIRQASLMADAVIKIKAN
ncbi:MAG: dihydropteroate synthase [Candidatus Omnitrophica bacterium]|nr:dihydropteroate synthase [Candidatus Omnitrophota bacterium]